MPQKHRPFLFALILAVQLAFLMPLSGQNNPGGNKNDEKAAVDELLGESPVSIALAPDPVLIVPGEHSQQLSLDFLVRNTGQAPLEFTALVLTAFDGKGALVTRLEINRLGMCPSIALLPFTVVEPGKTVISFNPFQALPPGLELKTLKFTFTFTAGGDG